MTEEECKKEECCEVTISSSDLQMASTSEDATVSMKKNELRSGSGGKNE